MSQLLIKGLAIAKAKKYQLLEIPYGKYLTNQTNATKKIFPPGKSLCRNGLNLLMAGIAVAK